MYGGDKPNDEKAMKAACHEKKGLINLFHCHLPGFHCPLMQVIHYRGFCLTAMALLPIGGGTLCYGSDDGGATVEAHTYVSKAMGYVGDIIRLSKHYVKDKEIIGPGDIEVHVKRGQEPGEPGTKYFFVDTARVFPPESPLNGDKRAIFFNLLRPEFVKKYKEPLCSDALSNWCIKSERKSTAKAIKEATEYLMKNVIPDFANTLKLKLYPNNNDLINALHAYGINIRHLGRVRAALMNSRSKVTEVGGLNDSLSSSGSLSESSPRSSATPERPNKPPPKLIPKKSGFFGLVTTGSGNPDIENASIRLLLTEIVARTLKNEIRSILREKMRTVKIATESPYIHMIHEYLQPILYYRPRGPEYMVKYSNTTYVANCPIPTTYQSFYMEFRVVVEEGPAAVGVIMCGDGTSELKQINLRSELSYSLTSDGAIYTNGKPSLYTKQIHNETVVGVYYCARNKVIIFTMNGQSLGATIQCEQGVYIPVLEGFKLIKANFGEGEFLFDIISFCAGLRYPVPSFMKQEKEIEKQHRKFWTKTLKNQLLSRYPDSLCDEELLSSVSLRDRIDFSSMILRLQEISGIKLSGRVVKTAVDDNKHMELQLTDVLAIKPCVSHISLIDFAEGAALLLQVEKGGIQDTKHEMLQLQDAQTKIVSGISGYEIPHYVYLLGNVYYQMAIRCSGPAKMEYLIRAETEYGKYNDANRKLYSFPDLDESYLKHHTSSLNATWIKTRFKEGFVILHKNMLNQDESMLKLFPRDRALLQAAEKFKEAFLLGGEERFLKYMKELRQTLYGCSAATAIQCLIEAQALKTAAVDAGFKNCDLWLHLTFITHKTISAIASKAIGENWPDATVKLFEEECSNFRYLYENHKKELEDYITELFTGGIMGTDLAVLIELVGKEDKLAPLVESALASQRVTWLTKVKREEEPLTQPSKQAPFDPSKIDEVCSACYFGDLASAEKYLATMTGPDVNLRNARGQTPLYCAAGSGNADLVDKILSIDGVDINCTENHGSTPLHAASFKGHAKVLSLLLSFGCDTTIKNKLKADMRSVEGQTARQESHRDMMPVWDAFDKNGVDGLISRGLPIKKPKKKVTQSDSARALGISNITPLVAKVFKTSKALKQMPIFAEVLDHTHKPLDQQERLLAIENIVSCYRGYTDNLRKLSNLKADIAADMDETEFRNLFGSPEIYRIAKEWLRRFEEILTSKVYLCAEVFTVMLATEKDAWIYYSQIHDQLETLHNLTTGPDSKNFLAKLRKYKFTVRELEEILKSTSKIHTELRRLLSDLIIRTPKDHVEFDQLQASRQQLDEIIKEQKEATATTENLRKLVIIANIITGCPFPIVSGGQTLIIPGVEKPNLSHSGYSNSGNLGSSAHHSFPRSPSSVNQSNISLTKSYTTPSKNTLSSSGSPSTNMEPPRAYIQHGGLQWVKETFTEKKLASVQQSGSQSLTWKPCIVIMLNTCLLITSDSRKSVEEELNDFANMRELNDFAYLRKINEARATLQYRHHIDLTSVVDIIDLSKKTVPGLFAVKLASGRFVLFKGESKNYRRWIFTLKDMKLKTTTV
eukprot:TRINITY_DN4514_c0_g1_i3.p1 TRINITY_DN4514_c0_g1~~TRINITY_DN4514_c0_g1_i3.p1  ORF type:complete len:1558 (-),score=367.99 TRINITY_DN4514_c0_g1_i3:36-4709(-)